MSSHKYCDYLEIIWQTFHISRKHSTVIVTPPAKNHLPLGQLKWIPLYLLMLYFVFGCFTFFSFSLSFSIFLWLFACKHTSTHRSLPGPISAQLSYTLLWLRHEMSCPLSTERQMVYLSTNKIVLKDQLVHFQAKVNWFFHHVYPPFQPSPSIKPVLFPPFLANLSITFLVR